MINKISVENKCIIYDIFKNGNKVFCIGPYYPTIFSENMYENIRCKKGEEDVKGNIINDPHKHTLIIEFDFKNEVDDLVIICIANEEYKVQLEDVKDINEKEIVMCTMFKNCAKFLENWIKYHKMIGIQHFYLYDNNSNDTELLNKVCEDYKDIVTLIRWPYPYVIRPSGISGQTSAQNHCIYKYGKKCKWIGLTDLDEYMYSKESSLLEILKCYENDDIGGILVPCLWFGCSFQVEYKNDFLEKLIYRKRTVDGCGRGGGPKGFIKPENVKVYSIHRIVNGKKQIVMNENKLRFNHYRILTNEGNNYKQLFRKNKGCICEIHDEVKDCDLADLWKTFKEIKHN